MNRQEKINWIVDSTGIDSSYLEVLSDSQLLNIVSVDLRWCEKWDTEFSGYYDSEQDAISSAISAAIDNELENI